MFKKTNINHKVKGFTIIEMLITLALTSLAIVFAYSTLNYVQKLFYNYKEQNKFINQFTDLKQRMDYESLNAKVIIEEGENSFTIKRDSITSTLKLLEKVILYKRDESHCDTFHIEAKKLKKEYELMKNPKWTNKLLKSLQFEIEYSKQKFNFYFYKNYDASIKLKMEEME